MKELPELSVNIKFCVRVSGISKEICHLLFFLYIYSHCKQMAFIMHTVFLQNNLIYGNLYHNQSWQHLGMWIIHPADCAHLAEVQNAAEQMYSSLFCKEHLLTSKGYRTAIKLDFLLEQTESRNALMSTVHKGKHVFHIKVLRLEICFVISLQASSCIWGKRKRAVRQDTQEVCATTVLIPFHNKKTRFITVRSLSYQKTESSKKQIVVYYVLELLMEQFFSLN